MKNVDYKKEKLFRGRMEVQIPKEFKDMPDYLAKKKYQSKHRPPVILMNEDSLVNYTFNLTEMPLPWNQLEKAAEGFLFSLKRAFPQAKFDKLQYEERTNGKIGWIIYESKAADADLFNIAFVTSLDGKVLYGSFNCLLEKREEWESIALYSIRSIAEIGGDES